MKKLFTCLVILTSLFILNPTDATTQDLSDHFAQFGIQIKPGSDTKENPIIGFDIYNNLYPNLTFQNMSGDTTLATYDPQTNYLGFLLSDLDFTKETKYQINSIEPSEIPYASVWTSVEEDIHLTKDQPVSNVEFQFINPIVLAIPEELSLETPVYMQSILTGTPTKAGTFPLIVAHGTNGTHFNLRKYNLIVSETSEESDLNETSIWSGEAHHLFIKYFDDWQRNMEQLYTNLTKESSQIQVGNYHLPNDGIGEVYFEGQLIKTKWYQEALEPNVFNIISVQSNHIDPNRTGEYTYYFAIKDGIGYPLIVDTEANADKLTFKTTLNDDLRLNFPNLVKEHITTTKNSQQISYDKIQYFNINNPTNIEALQSIKVSDFAEATNQVATDETIITFGTMNVEADPQLEAILIEDNAVYLSDLLSLEDAIYTLHKNAAVVGIERKEPIHLKINEPALIGTFSSIPEFYNVPDGMQAYASYEFHQRYGFIYGVPTKKGHYETIVTSHKNGGSLYLTLQPIIVE